jgi:ABC-type polysaccharide/polyol phosphate export permease
VNVHPTPLVLKARRETRRFAALLGQWTARDFRTRYRVSSLRAVWAVLQPFFFVAVYVIIFGVIFDQSGGDLPYLSYLLSGVVIYRVVSSAMSSGSCLVDNYGLICQASFPRAVIPISQVLGNGLDLAVTVVGLLVVMRVQGVHVTHTVVFLPIVVLGVLLFAFALCTFLATAQVFIRDLQFVIPFAVMGLFFASPISYQPDQLPGWLRWLDWANPISVFVRALRDVTLVGRWPDGWFWAHLVGSALLLVAAIAHLRSVEHRIADLG